MYSPVNRSKASGGSGEYVTQGGGIPPPCARATKLAMTVTVKTMDVQRCVCRIQMFHFTGTSFRRRAPEADRACVQGPGNLRRAPCPPGLTTSKGLSD